MRVVICGSMTESRLMLDLERRLREDGHSVDLPEFTAAYASLENVGQMHTESARNKMEHDLIRKYYYTIRDGDAILVANVKRHGIDNYIGGNSFLEMGFAHILSKPIYLLNPVPQMSYSDELVAMRPIVINGDLSLIS
ncbi:TPA: hypothetical protein HA251_07315 [Candidatus Woesearchaeota archaeon]|nr:hypothetical protein [Candidatus Woesearchaeota archaeon]